MNTHALGIAIENYAQLHAIDKGTISYDRWLCCYYCLNLLTSWHPHAIINVLGAMPKHVPFLESTTNTIKLLLSFALMLPTTSC